MNKNGIKGFVVGAISTLAIGGVVYGATLVNDVYLSPYKIKINGEEYKNEMPVLNYEGRTYLALRELGTVLGNKVDFVNDEILINSNEILNNAKDSFIKAYFLNSEDKIDDYVIKEFKLIDGEERAKFEEEGILEKDDSLVYAQVEYEFKPHDINARVWDVGNGMVDGEWVREKSLFLTFKVEDGVYTLISSGTGI